MPDSFYKNLSDKKTSDELIREMQKSMQLISEMHTLLKGDDYGNEGLANKVNRHEKTINKHNAFFYIISVLAAIFTAIVAFVEDIFNIFK